MMARHVLRATASHLSRQSKCFFSSTSRPQADFTHAVIGAGVVGTAIARQLANRPDTSTVLIERHGAIGTETSSRNSEVIHAGIYYGSDTLKSKLCIRGKHLLYSLCEQHDIPHRNTGKWIVAQNDTQREALEKTHSLCRDTLGVPTRWVSQDEIARDGQGVRAAAGALESPSTGIVDSHSLMTCLLGLFENSDGILALNTPVHGVRQTNDSQWELDVLDGSSGEHTTISAEIIVNAAGLGAADIHNMIVPSEQHRRLYYAKGNYFSYSASSPSISRLIYPAPEPGAGGLGTHLTLDMGGRMRFGPDVEWVEDPNDLAVSASRLQEAVKEIKKYLPAVDENCLEPDYSGIRPKLANRGAVMSGSGFNDFIIRKEEGYQGWVNLLGIESPGLTSSIAIAEMVEELLYGSIRQPR